MKNVKISTLRIVSLLFLQIVTSQSSRQLVPVQASVGLQIMIDLPGLHQL